jgi:hypothetical protein
VAFATMLPPFDFAGDLVTEPFVFEKEISSDESFALSDVRALSTKRRTLCAFKGDGNPTDAAARSHAADEYVPHLEALVGKIGELGVTADRQQRFSFQWNSPLEGLGNTFKLSDIKQELGMAWMMRAACKRQEAVVAVDKRPRAVVGPARHETDDDRLVVIGGSVLGTPPPGAGKQTGAEKSPKSPGPVLGESAPAIATALRVAAGLYKHAALNILPQLKDDLPGERPNELLASMAETMRLVCLAEAQAATVRRAEEKATANKLLAKLHLGVCDLYAAADKSLNDHVSDFNRISRKLQACILLGISLHRARAYRCAAEDAFVTDEVGEAVCLSDAGIKHLQKCVVAAGEQPRWKAAISEEMDALVSSRNVYAKENEVVYFQKVPDKPKWRLPEGKVIVTEIKHKEDKDVNSLFTDLTI